MPSSMPRPSCGSRSAGRDTRPATAVSNRDRWNANPFSFPLATTICVEIPFSTPVRRGFPSFPAPGEPGPPLGNRHRKGFPCGGDREGDSRSRTGMRGRGSVFFDGGGFGGHGLRLGGFFQVQLCAHLRKFGATVHTAASAVNKKTRSVFRTAGERRRGPRLRHVHRCADGHGTPPNDRAGGPAKPCKRSEDSCAMPYCGINPAGSRAG